MGQSSSKKHKYDFSERQPLVPKVQKRNPKAYSLPEQRKKRRYRAVEKNPPGAYEASIDKYDYLLIFPFTEGEYRQPRVDSDRDLTAEERWRGTITWRRAEEIWRRIIPGSEAQKDEALDRLIGQWEKYTGYKTSDEEQMYNPAWKTLARETVLDQLANKNGLQLKISANSSYVFCRVRAPIKLLEQQADIMNYPLKLRDAVDPGSESFWNLEYKGISVEVEEERRLLSKEEALDVLEHLYRAGKVPPSEVEVNEAVETQAMWSRRVHTLERIADNVPVSNKYPAYAAFYSDKPHLRFLYQTYASVRGESLFLPKDRLILTKSIIENSIDTSKMIGEGLLLDFFPLHDANRGEQLTTEKLRARWVDIFFTSSKLVGAPTVSHEAYEDDIGLWFFWRPFAQPLKNIRDYFGEEIAMFYAWYGFFTFALLFPALLSAGMEVLFFLRGFTDTVEHFDWPKYGYAVAIITWAMLYILMWFRENYAVALKWGTHGFESEEADRPQFIADPVIKTVLSNVDSSRITYYPESRRVCTQLGSNLSICWLIGCTMCFLLAILYGEAVAIDFNSNWWGTLYVDWIVAVILAFTAHSASLLFRGIAVTLNDNENYRADTEYKDALVQKVAVFDLSVNLSMCYFVAYGKGPLLNTCFNTCMGDLRRLLYAIIGVRVAFTLLDVFGSIIAQWLKIHRLQESASKRQQKKAMKAQQDEEDVQFELELRLMEPESTLASFSSCYMQFTYINLFSSAVPLLPIIALGENLLLLRVRALYLCSLAKRPHPKLAEDAGKWAEYMELIVYVGIYTTTATFVYGLRDMSDYGLMLKTIIFLITSLVLMGYVARIKLWLPAEPIALQKVRERQEFVVDKYVKGFEDDDEDLVAPSYEPTSLDDAVDVDGMTLYTIRPSQKLTIQETLRIKELELQRRDLLKVMRSDRDELEDVYSVEMFDKVAGVGRKRATQLPLGRLQVKLMCVDELDDGDLVDYEYVGNTASPFAGIGHEDGMLRKEIRFASRRYELFVRISFRDLEVNGTTETAMQQQSDIFPSRFLNFGSNLTFSKDLTDSNAFKLDSAKTKYEFEGRQLGPFSPIGKQTYLLVFHLMQRRVSNTGSSTPFSRRSDDSKPRFIAEYKLEDLADQQMHELCLSFSRCDKNGNRVLNDESTDVKLVVQLMFQYSKILPLKKRLRENEEQLRLVEKELALIGSGNVDPLDIQYEDVLQNKSQEQRHEQTQEMPQRSESGESRTEMPTDGAQSDAVHDESDPFKGTTSNPPASVNNPEGGDLDDINSIM